MRPPHIIDDHFKARSLLRRLEVAPNLFGIDTETVGVDPRTQSPVKQGSIFCWSVAWYDAQSKVSSPEVPERAYISGDLLPLFAHWLADDRVHKVGHNVFSFDLHMFANHGVPLRGIVGDTLRMSKLAFNHPDARHGLKPLSKAILGLEMEDYSELFSRPGRGKAYDNRTNVSFKRLELIPLNELPDYYPDRLTKLYDYASKDAYATLLLYDYFKAKLEEIDLWDYYVSVWNPMLYTLVEMEQAGIRLDREVCEQGIEQCTLEQQPIEQRILEYVDWHPPNRLPNLNSNDDRPYLVYGSQALAKDVPAHLRSLWPLGADRSPVCGSLKAIKKTKRGKWPTDQGALTYIAQEMGDADGEFCRDLLRWRGLENEVSKYKMFPKHMRGDRIHYCLRPDTNTGRLSASNAAIQQVPKKGKIREAFTAGPNKQLIVADYSSLELRVLAHFLVDRFGDGGLATDLSSEDLHSSTAKRLGMSRDYAKAVNYSVVYDKSAMGLGLQLGVPTDEAQEILYGWYDIYPGAKRLKDDLERFAAKNGYVETLHRRRRYIPELRSNDDWEYARGYRKLTSTLIQGSAADFVTMAMLRTNPVPRPELTELGYFDEGLYDLKVQQLCQVHDELIFECPKENAPQAAERVKLLMEHAMELRVPLPANVQIAQNWAEGK